MKSECAPEHQVLLESSKALHLRLLERSNILSCLAVWVPAGRSVASRPCGHCLCLGSGALSRACSHPDGTQQWPCPTPGQGSLPHVAGWPYLLLRPQKPVTSDMPGTRRHACCSVPGQPTAGHGLGRLICVVRAESGLPVGGRHPVLAPGLGESSGFPEEEPLPAVTEGWTGVL